MRFYPKTQNPKYWLRLIVRNQLRENLWHAGHSMTPYVSKDPHRYWDLQTKNPCQLNGNATGLLLSILDNGLVD